MADRVHVTRTLEVDRRRAVALRQLRLLYQPQLSLGDSRIISAEALLRCS